jgi:flagellar motor switch protein FliM
VTGAAAQPLMRLHEGSERSRRACARFDGIARLLESAVKRSLPYLVRARTPVVAAPVEVGLYGEIVERLSSPRYVAPLRAGACDVGALVLDAQAVARGLDGVLGGGKGEPSRLDPGGLSAPQAALAARLTRGLCAAFDEVLTRLDVRIEIAPGSAPERHGGLFLACSIAIGGDDAPGHIVLLLPSTAVEVSVAPPAPVGANNPLAAAALAAVEVEIVAELGRVRVPLARIASLKVGDVLRLPLPVDAPARVVAGGRPLFDGRPTTRGAQIAIEVARHGA